MSLKEFDASNQGLDELAAQIRAALQASESGMCNALHNAMDAGDALIVAKSRIPKGDWRRWLESNCSPLSTRGALLYMQLARSRDDIEVEIRHIGYLSLRAARQFIMKSDAAEKKKTKAEKKPAAPAIIAAMSKATDAELTEALAALERVMPAEWRPQLETRLGDQIISRAKAQHPNVRLKNLNKAKLQLVGGTEASPTSH
jgi:hypothetical protein